MTFLFTYFDWKVIQFTRFSRPEFKEWMHQNERTYANVKWTIEAILCTPCIPFKPILHEVIKKIETTEAEEAAITHAPPMSWSGFYRPVKRGEPYKFTSWLVWFTYFLAPSVLWWQLGGKYLVTRDATNPGLLLRLWDWTNLHSPFNKSRNKQSQWKRGYPNAVR